MIKEDVAHYSAFILVITHLLFIIILKEEPLLPYLPLIMNIKKEWLLANIIMNVRRLTLDCKYKVKVGIITASLDYKYKGRVVISQVYDFYTC